MKKTITQKTLYPNEAENLRTRVVGKEVEVSYEIEVAEPQNQETGPEETKGTKEWLDKYFPVVHASTLSLDDEILKHKPETESQKDFKERLEKAIKSGLQDFRAPRMDPSLDENGNICFKEGRMPAVGESTIWWKKKAKEFLPEKESRLGLTKERIAFLALLMKELIEEWGYNISDAWKAVCDESKDLGHYWDSQDAKHGLETTGSRQVGRWNDLGNTYKITEDEAGGFSLVGGDFGNRGYNCPLSDVNRASIRNSKYLIGLGWLVLSV